MPFDSRQPIHHPLIFSSARDYNAANVRSYLLLREPEQHHGKYVPSAVEPLSMLDFERCLWPRREELLQPFRRYMLARTIRQHHEPCFVVLRLPRMQKSVCRCQCRTVRRIQWTRTTLRNSCMRGRRHERRQTEQNESQSESHATIFLERIAVSEE